VQFPPPDSEGVDGGVGVDYRRLRCGS
jgi:hypothetical protein